MPIAGPESVALILEPALRSECTSHDAKPARTDALGPSACTKLMSKRLALVLPQTSVVPNQVPRACRLVPGRRRRIPPRPAFAPQPWSPSLERCAGDVAV